MSEYADWPKDTCTNCNQVSYTLATRGKCPYCDKDLFVEKLVESKCWNKEKIKNSIEKYKINISEEFKRIEVFKKAFDKEFKIIESKTKRFNK